MTKAEKRLERAKKEYIDALKAFEHEEEIRIAMQYQPKVSLNNIMYYSAYYQGARMALLRINEDCFGNGKDSKVYKDAVMKLITSELRYTAMYMDGSTDIFYRNHKRDKKGKLISCEAYFGKPVTIYREL